nr:BCCT family transporter [Streptomyces sp. NBC_00857]
MSSVAPRVFWPAIAVVIGFVLYAVIGQGVAARQVQYVQRELASKLSWYYVALVSLFVVFALWMCLGRFGSIRLAKDDEKPEFSVGAWLTMLFTAGMGIGLVFWGVAEPLTFFAEDPRPGVGGDEAARSEAAMVQTFLHWGIHPWAIYVVVGLAVANSVHRKGRSVSIRWALEPIFGDRVKGAWGDAIDVVAIVGTLFGVATSLGLGVMQVASGLDFIDAVHDPGKPVLVVLIIVITGITTLSVVSGIGRGIKWLSNVNVGLAAAVALFVLVAGPTLFIFNGLVQDLGGYLQNMARLSFDTGASHGAAGTEWVNRWTVFYWGWWISWAPFVGVFIARISRGRTVREFVCGVLLVPTLLNIAWFAIFGGSALHNEVFGQSDIVGAGDKVNEDNALFQLLQTLPGGTFVVGVAILLGVLFFVTSSDSGSYVVVMLASGGNPTPPIWGRALWALMEGAVAIALLVASDSESDTASLDTLKTVAIIIALPFSVVMIGMCVATLKSFRKDYPVALTVRQESRQGRAADELEPRA